MNSSETSLDHSIGTFARRLFFVAYGGGHVAMLMPVAKAAMARGHEVVFLGLTTARPVLEKAGIRCIGFADLWSHAASSALAFGESLAAGLAPGGVVSREESVAYLGISYADLVEEHGEREAAELYARAGRHAFLPVAFLERVLAAYAPDVVVASNSPRAEQAALLASRRLGIAAVCAVDLFALQEVRWIGQPCYADRLCVLNDAVRDMFLSHGRLPSEVVVTGNPAFDALLERSSIDAGVALRRARGWDDGRINVMWASQIEPLSHPFNGTPGDPTLPRRVEARLRLIVRGNDRLRLVVRYHPSEREAFIEEEGVEFSPTTEPLAHLLHAVDLVVVTASTVGLEASIAGRPVITVDCSVFTDDAPYSKMGISKGFSDPESLSGALLETLSKIAPTAEAGTAEDPQVKKSASSAASRVFEVIETLLFDGV